MIRKAANRHQPADDQVDESHPIGNASGAEIDKFEDSV